MPLNVNILLSALLLVVPFYIVTFSPKTNITFLFSYFLYFIFFLINIKPLKFYSNKILISLLIFILLWILPNLYNFYINEQYDTFKLYGLLARLFFFTALILGLLSFSNANSSYRYKQLIFYLFCFLSFFIFYISFYLFKHFFEFYDLPLNNLQKRIWILDVNNAKLESNFIGLIFFTYFLLLQKIRNHYIKFVFSITILFLLAYVIQSRTYLFASFLAIFIYYYDFIKYFVIRFYILTFFGLLIFFYNLTFFLDLVLFYDELRGINSGFSGRFDLWKYWFDILLQNPYVGIGHAKTITDVTITSSTHNFFLRIAVENGVFLCIFSFIISLVTIFKLFTKKLNFELAFFCSILFAFQFDNWSINLFFPNIILYLCVLISFSNIQKVKI